METRKPSKRAQYNITPRQFVTAWCTSESAQEVADKLGLRKGLVLGRASRYRKAGVKLKQLGDGRKLDVEALNRLAEKALNEQGGRAAE